jgi:hypothetical protein
MRGQEFARLGVLIASMLDRMGPLMVARRIQELGDNPVGAAFF